MCKRTRTRQSQDLLKTSSHKICQHMEDVSDWDKLMIQSSYYPVLSLRSRLRRTLSPANRPDDLAIIHRNSGWRPPWIGSLDPWHQLCRPFDVSQNPTLLMTPQRDSIPSAIGPLVSSTFHFCGSIWKGRWPLCHHDLKETLHVSYLLFRACHSLDISIKLTNVIEMTKYYRKSIIHLIILHNDIYYNTYENNDYRECDDENNDSYNFCDGASSN